MEETYEPYKYLWRKYMQDYLHEIKDAGDLRNHLIKTLKIINLLGTYLMMKLQFGIK